MTIANSLKPLVRAIRGIPGVFGLRTHRVFVIASRFTGPYTGDGSRSNTEFELTEGSSRTPPKVRWLKSDEIAVGGLAAGTVEVGPITPDLDGYTEIIDAIAATKLGTGDLRYIKLIGPNHPNGANYRVTDAAFESAMHFTLKCSPVEDSA